MFYLTAGDNVLVKNFDSKHLLRNSKRGKDLCVSGHLNTSSGPCTLTFDCLYFFQAASQIIVSLWCRNCVFLCICDQYPRVLNISLLVLEFKRKKYVTVFSIYSLTTAYFLWLPANISQCVVNIKNTQHQVIYHIQHLQYQHTSSQPAFKMCLCLLVCFSQELEKTYILY